MALMLLFFGPAVAQGQQDSPAEGLTVGPWILAPYLLAGAAVDDNIFLSSEGAEDTISTFSLGLDATLPFRNSSLELAYKASKMKYEQHDFSRDTTEEGRFELDLRLGSLDRLVVRGLALRSFTDLSRSSEEFGGVDPGDERFFDGQPYHYNRFELELSRLVPRQQGYLIRVTRVDLNYLDTSNGTAPEERPFDDYRGFDAAYEFRQPLSANRWLIGYYQMRRFNHYDASFGTGVERGNETSDTLQIGLRGPLGKGQPLFVRVGYGRFVYDGLVGPSGPLETQRHSDLAGYANWALKIGGRSSLVLSAGHATLPTTTNFYVNTVFRAEFSRKWFQHSTVGINTILSSNRYGARQSDDFVRQDYRYELEARLDWLLHERFGFVLAGRYSERESNNDPQFGDIYSYQGAQISLYLAAGWF
jgi:hypothetical protein